MTFILAMLLVYSLVQSVVPTELGDLRDQIQDLEDIVGRRNGHHNEKANRVYKPNRDHEIEVFSALFTGNKNITVGCPSGYVLVGCSSSGLEEAYTCGNYITSDHKCGACSRTEGIYITARASCIPADENEVTYVEGRMASGEPFASCARQTMLDCMLTTEHPSKYEGMDFPRGWMEDDACWWDQDNPCRSDSLCTAYGICGKIYGNR